MIHTGQDVLDAKNEVGRRNIEAARRSFEDHARLRGVQAAHEARAIQAFHAHQDIGRTGAQAVDVNGLIGQAAWILEKFWAWTDCQGHPENALGRDELLDNVMLYWLTGTGASSARLYWESFNTPPMESVKVPVGCSIFPKEIFRSSKRWAEKHFGSLLHWNELAKGGHFAAFELPEVFVDELRECFRSLR